MLFSKLKKAIKPGFKHAASALLSLTLCVSLWACAEPAKKIRLRGRPATAESQVYRFIAFGDWGAGTPFQKEIAAQTIALYRKEPFNAVLMLGDNIYSKGDVKTYGRPYFTETYGPLIEQGVQFIVALGNHDRVGGFEEDQLHFFKMPGYYYEVHKPNVDFFVLETNLFANDTKQQEWLEAGLKASHAPWKIVLGHHPIYSSGQHGMNGGLQRSLEPILQRYHVPLYLAGHDHDYERLEPIKGVQYIVSGGGGAYLRGASLVLPQSKLYVKKHHFLSFQVTHSHLCMEAIDASGKEIDHLDMTQAEGRRKHDE
jgi:hypothetical protein